MIELGLALAAAGVAAAAGFAVRRAWRSRQDLTELPPPTGASLGVEGAPEGSVVLRVEGEPPDVTVLARESVRFDGRALETGDPAFDSVALATGPETLLAAWLSDDVREELRWLLGAGVTVVDGVGHAPRRVAGSRDGQALLDRLAAVLDRLQEAVAAPIARLGRVDPSIPLSRLRLEHLLEQAPASAEAARMVRWALEAGQSGFDDTVRRRMARHQLDAIVAVAQDAALPVGVRATALRTLGSGNFPTEALKTLRRAVRHEDESIRRTAVERLGLAKRDAVRKALGPLQIAAEDERASVRRAAMTALGRLGDEPGVEADSVATLAAGLEDSAASVSRAAAKALARLQSDAGIDALIALLEGATGRSLRVYADSLARIGDPRAEGALTRAAGRLEGEDQLAVVSALGEFGGRDAVQPLLELASGWLSSPLKKAALGAVASIQERLGAAPAGSLAVVGAEGAEGGLSLGHESGGLSLEPPAPDTPGDDVPT